MKGAQYITDEWHDELDEDRKLRDLWCYLYRLYPADRADRLLDLQEIPRPPSRACRTP